MGARTHSGRRRGRLGLVIAAILAAGVLAAVAYADQVVPDGDIVTTGDQASVSLGTVSPGAVLTPKTSFKLECNGNKHIDNAQSVDLAFSSADSTVPFGGSLSATNSSIGPIPSSWPDDGTNCSSSPPAPIGDNGDSTVTITAPSFPGSYTYVVQWNASVGSPDVTGKVQITYTLTVAAPSDTTSPDSGSISINGGAAWTNDTAVSVDISAHDATGVASYRLAETQAGLASATAHSVSPAEVAFSRSDLAFTLSSGDATAKSVWARFCDAGDNCSDASDTIGLDTVNPVITGSTGSYTPGTWTNQSVTVSFSCADAGTTQSGIDTDTVAGATLSSSGENQSVTNTGSCTDNAGNVAAGATVGDIDIDKQAPVITADTGGYTPGSWTGQDVTVTFSCADAGPVQSGIGTDTVPDVTLTTSGADQSVTNTGSCKDSAGNEAASVTVSDIDIDKDAPLLNISGPAGGSTFGACSGAPTRPTFSPSDPLSGLDGSEGDSWTTPATATGAGTYTYSAHARDNVGNAASETRQYTVAYGSAFSGFLQPINSDGSSRFKLGSTVPVKFQLLCGGVPITNAVAKLYVAKGDSAADPGVDEAISTSAATTGNLFRYDATSQQYIFNLSTKLGYTNPGGGNVSFSQGSWTLKILLDDGTWRSVAVQLPK